MPAVEQNQGGGENNQGRKVHQGRLHQVEAGDGDQTDNPGSNSQVEGMDTRVAD